MEEGGEWRGAGGPLSRRRTDARAVGLGGQQADDLALLQQHPEFLVINQALIPNGRCQQSLGSHNKPFVHFCER